MLNTLKLKKKKSDAVSTEAGIDSPFTVDPASRNIAAQNTEHRSIEYSRTQNTEYRSIEYSSTEYTTILAGAEYTQLLYCTNNGKM